MIDEKRFRDEIWPSFWKVFPNVSEQQAERLGPVYYEEFHEFQPETITEVFTWLRKNFVPGRNEPLPSIATINKRIMDMFAEKNRQTHQDAMREEEIPAIPPKKYFDCLLQLGFKHGPYKGKTDEELKSLGQILYDNYCQTYGEQHATATSEGNSGQVSEHTEAVVQPDSDSGQHPERERNGEGHRDYLCAQTVGNQPVR